MKIWSSINLPWGHVMSHKKFGPDWFSCFDVYWIQTNKHINKHPPRQAKFIYRLGRMYFFSGTLVLISRGTRHLKKGMPNSQRNIFLVNNLIVTVFLAWKQFNSYSWLYCFCHQKSANHLCRETTIEKNPTWIT